MTTDKTIEEMNEALAVFDGWEKVTVGYYGQHTSEEDDETPWQVENRAWLDQMEIESVGTYWVKVKENKVYDGHEIKYHEDWNQTINAWKKLRAEIWQNNNGSYPAGFMKFFEDWKRECFNGHIQSAHKILYEAIQFNTTTKQMD